jgi:hypothetical protein
VSTTSADILRWGGVFANNGAYLTDRGADFLDELLHLANVLQADRLPSPREIWRREGETDTPCRMNAGFVKIYSVWLDYLVIYNGRVGAALGLLTRQFCEQTGRGSVPETLAFAYGSPKESPTTLRPKVRNPSEGLYRFPRLRPGWPHVVQAMKASRFLRAVLDAGPHPFSQGEDGFHESAAGLFMVGYDLPTSSSEAVFVPKQRNPSTWTLWTSPQAPDAQSEGLLGERGHPPLRRGVPERRRRIARAARHGRPRFNRVDGSTSRPRSSTRRSRERSGPATTTR